MPAGQNAKCLTAALRWAWLAQSPAAPSVGPPALWQAGRSWVVSRSSKRTCLTPRSTSGPSVRGHKGLGAAGTVAQLSCFRRFLSTNICLNQLPRRNETPRGPAGTLPLFHGHSHLKSDFVCPRRDSRSLYRGSVPLSSSLKPPSHPCVSGLVFVFVFFLCGKRKREARKMSWLLVIFRCCNWVLVKYWLRQAKQF